MDDLSVNLGGNARLSSLDRQHGLIDAVRIVLDRTRREAWQRARLMKNGRLAEPALIAQRNQIRK